MDSFTLGFLLGASGVFIIYLIIKIINKFDDLEERIEKLTDKK